MCFVSFYFAWRLVFSTRAHSTEVLEGRNFFTLFVALLMSKKTRGRKHLGIHLNCSSEPSSLNIFIHHLLLWCNGDKTTWSYDANTFSPPSLSLSCQRRIENIQLIGPDWIKVNFLFLYSIDLPQVKMGVLSFGPFVDSHKVCRFNKLIPYHQGESRIKFTCQCSRDL